MYKKLPKGLQQLLEQKQMREQENKWKKINNTQIDNIKDIDVVMSIYKLIERSDNS